MTTDAKRLGRQIKKARDAKGWTQPQLAERYTREFGRGGSERAVWDWENGVRPPKGKTLLNLRMLLDLEGSEDEAVAAWPARVRQVVDVLCDQFDTLPDEELKAWRHEIIVGLMADRYDRRRPEWKDDVVVISEVVGAKLAPLED